MLETFFKIIVKHVLIVILIVILGSIFIIEKCIQNKLECFLKKHLIDISLKNTFKETTFIINTSNKNIFKCTLSE